MDDQTTQLHHIGSCKRWPSIGWPLEAYQKHLNGEPPAHPVDLYLGGAAGHRLKAAWSVIESELSPEVMRIMSRLPKADYVLEDLWGDTRQNMIKDYQPRDDDPVLDDLPDGSRPANIIRYRARVPLVNYLVTAAKRLAITRDAKHKPKLGLTHTSDASGEEHTRPLADTDQPLPDQSASDQESASALSDAVAAAFATLSDEQRFLIRMVYDRGVQKREAGAMLDWPDYKVSRSLKDAMGRLREQLGSVAGLDWTPALQAAWAGAWSQEWESDGAESVQVRRPGASDAVATSTGGDSQ